MFILMLTWICYSVFLKQVLTSACIQVNFNLGRAGIVPLLDGCIWRGTYSPMSTVKRQLGQQTCQRRKVLLVTGVHDKRMLISIHYEWLMFSLCQIFQNRQCLVCVSYRAQPILQSMGRSCCQVYPFQFYNPHHQLDAKNATSQASQLVTQVSTSRTISDNITVADKHRGLLQRARPLFQFLKVWATIDWGGHWRLAKHQHQFMFVFVFKIDPAPTISVTRKTNLPEQPYLNEFLNAFAMLTSSDKGYFSSITP